MMEKSYKHSNDYIGSFSENPHVAQCYTCWLSNYSISNASNGCTSENRNQVIKEINEEFLQEWHQKKSMERKPIEKEFFNDGSTKIIEEMFFCQPCQDSWGDDDEECSYEELGQIHQSQILRNERPYKVELLN